MDQELQQALLGVVRHFLTAAGGVLVTAGYATSDQTAAIVNSTLGIAAFAVGVAWSWWQKKQAAKAKQVAVASAIVDTANAQSAATKPFPGAIQ